MPMAQLRERIRARCALRPHEKTSHTDRLGQSTVELALLLPILVILLLGAVDFAQVLSARQRLTQGTHLAVLALLKHPDKSAPASLSAYIQAESGLSPVTATSTYTLGADGADQVMVTAGYSYTLLMPGLRNMQTHSITNGKLDVTVSAAGVAATDPPTVANPQPQRVTVTPPAPGSDNTVPSGLALTCTLFQNGAEVDQGACSASSPLVWQHTGPPGSNPYTATVTQLNGVTSPPSAQVMGP